MKQGPLDSEGQPLWLCGTVHGARGIPACDWDKMYPEFKPERVALRRVLEIINADILAEREATRRKRV